MKISKKRLLAMAALLIAAGLLLFGFGSAAKQENEGSSIMEHETYALSQIHRIQIETDSPSVVIQSVSGEQINLSWQTDEYVTYDAKVSDGELTVDYRFSSNWLDRVLRAPLSRRDYVLTVELPESYNGGLVIRTASGTVTVDTPAELNECRISTVSGSIDLAEVESQVSVEVHSTSGSVSVSSVNADGDLIIQTVSGAVELRGSASEGSVSLQTASGSVTGTELIAAEGLTVKTISGRVELKHAHCDADVALESTSGSIRPSDLECSAFTAKTVSGSISPQNLSADRIELSSTSGSVNAAISGAREDYSITAKTVSGSSNLQSSGAGKAKTLKVSTVSGSVDVKFSGN